MANYAEPIIHTHIFTGTEKVEQMLEKFHKEFVVNKKSVVVYFDPDIDGLISGVLVCRYLALKGIGYSWYINSNRSHGFLLNTKRINNTNIINVDSAIPRSIIRELVDNGNNIISMDHHINEKYFIEEENKKLGTQGIVVDNHYVTEEESGTYLSGAGVVFETLTNILPSYYTRENRALVGLTLLSDVCPIENKNAHGYLYELYNHPYRGYIKYLIDGVKASVDYTFGVPRLDRNFVDYTFSPALNSCFRFNKQDMCVNFALGSGSVDLSYKDLQRELVNKMMEASETAKLSNVIFIKVRKERIATEFADTIANEYIDILSNFIGLVANRYLGQGKSSIAVLIEKDGTISRGSFRGCVTGADYLKELTKDNLIQGAGHESAFGILQISLTKSICMEINKRCKKVDEESDGQEKTIIHVGNMSSFLSGRASRIAEDNLYCLSQHRTYVQYTGDNIRTVKRHDRFIQHYIDGVEVKCFDSSLDIKKDLILPISERGKLNFYLDVKAE
jgi:single-stranded-DNA-specific exonuclease